MAVHMHRHTDPLQQLRQAGQLETHHRTADVVGVVVRRQHAGQMHAVGLQRVDQITGGVGRVDDDAVAGFAVADEVGEVAHLGGDHVADGEVAPGEQLAEVEAVRIRHAPQPKAAGEKTARRGVFNGTPAKVASSMRIYIAFESCN
jgi:hypothetical protein